MKNTLGIPGRYPLLYVCHLSLPLLLLLLLLSISQSVFAADKATLSAQRAQFVAAEKALRKGDGKKYRAYKAQLKHYPLYPYLEYQEIKRRISRVSAHKVDTFLHAYADSPVTDRLRVQWLTHLAKKSRWKDYIRFYLPTTNVKRQCHYLQALLQTSAQDKAFTQVEPLWLSGKSQPNACDPVFAAWRKAGHLTTQLVWRRIEMAMNKRQSKLARYLSQFLSKDDKRLVDLWRKIYRDPGIILSARALRKDTPRARTILAYGVKRLALRGAKKALDAWHQLQTTHQFSAEQKNLLLRYIGIRMATQKVPGAATYLAQLPQSAEDKTLRDWRIRVSIQKSDWKNVLHWINQLPKKEKSAENWNYWKARALELTDHKEDANKIYRQLGQERSYYGFLSADRLNIQYQFSDTPLQITPLEFEQLNTKPGIQRAHEFYRLQRFTNARREWHKTTNGLSTRELEIAAKLADLWNWYDRAIITIAKARYWDDLETRFPLAFRESLMEKAHQQDIETAWVYAVVRQESAFITDARSPVGALGLMQLLPRTAKQIARQQKQPISNKHELLKADTNLTLGTAYLRSVLNKLDNNPVLATAAYNAGPHRVKQWLPEQTAVPADVWVELVPFHETRDYLRRVLAYTVIYEQRLGLSPTPLRERMRPVRILGSILTDSKAITKT